MEIAGISHLFIALIVLGIPIVQACTPSQYECDGHRGKWTCEPRSALCDHQKQCLYGDDETNCDVIPGRIIYCGKYPSKDGYYQGHHIECSCTANHEGRDYKKQRGTAVWYQDANLIGEEDHKIVMRSNGTDLDIGYDCMGRSGYGMLGAPEKLRPKFAYVDKGHAKITAKTVTICPGEVITSARVWCTIPVAHANPAPLFTFVKSDGEINLHEPETGKLFEGEYYMQLPEGVGPDGGGDMDVQCKVTNAQFEKEFDVVPQTITFIRPPTQPPVVEINGQTFQGMGETNVATLRWDFSGELTCNIHGGFPVAKITLLSCGSNKGFPTGPTGSIRFQNELVVRAMHNVHCFCEASEHESGCYDAGTTKVTLRVQFLPGKEPKEEKIKKENDSESDKKSDAQDDGDKDGGGKNMISTVVAILLAVVVVILLVIIVVLVMRQRRMQADFPEAERVGLREAKA